MGHKNRISKKGLFPYFLWGVAYYQLNCAKTDLATNLPMVYVPWFNLHGPLKSKVSPFFLLILFHLIGLIAQKPKKSVVYVPWFNLDGPRKSEVSYFKNLKFFNCQVPDPKIVLVLGPRILKLEGQSFGFEPYIYVLKGCYKETTQKFIHNSDFGGFFQR